MIKNTGTLDRAARVVAGLALIALSATGMIGIWGYVIAAVLLLTAIVSFCPIHAMFGWNTCAIKK
jgi:Protein of unknown function (DUF2892)